MTLDEALTHLRALTGFTSLTQSEYGVSETTKEALELVLAEFPVNRFSKPLPLGLVVEDESTGHPWVLVAIRPDASGKTEYKFVDSTNDYKYRANSPQTLIKRFPGLKEYV